MVIKSNRMAKMAKSLFITCVLILLLPLTVSAINYPAPTSVFYVNDYAGVLDTETERFIESAAAALERTTSAQVVVVTLNGIGDNALEEYSLGLFREWGIGDARKNNGVLILLDIGGRQTRIEVGYGLEGALPDGKTGRIQDNAMSPHFSAGNYSRGIKDGFIYIVNEIYNEYGLTDSFIGDDMLIDDVYGSDFDYPPIYNMIIVGIIIVLIILDFMFTGGVFTFSILRMLTDRVVDPLVVVVPDEVAEAVPVAVVVPGDGKYRCWREKMCCSKVLVARCVCLAACVLLLLP